MAWEIGEEELVGSESLVAADDVESILGEDADRFHMGASRRASAAVKAVIARRLAASGTVLRDRAPQKSRMYPLGLDSTTAVATLATANVQNNPQVVFRPERLVVSGAIAQFFVLNSLVVGKNLQFAAAGAMPCDAFGPNSFGVRLKMDTAQINSVIIANVTNIDGAGHRFLATLLGEAVE